MKVRDNLDLWWTTARACVEYGTREEALQILGRLGFTFLFCLVGGWVVGYSLVTCVIVALVATVAFSGWAVWAAGREIDTEQRMSWDGRAAAENYALRLLAEGRSAALVGVYIVWLGLGPSFSGAVIAFSLFGWAWAIHNLIAEARNLSKNGETHLLGAWVRLVGIMFVFGAGATLVMQMVLKLGGLGLVPAGWSFGFKPKAIEYWILVAMLALAVWDINRMLCRKLGRQVAEQVAQAD